MKSRAEHRSPGTSTVGKRSGIRVSPRGRIEKMLRIVTAYRDAPQLRGLTFADASLCCGKLIDQDSTVFRNSHAALAFTEAKRA
jgi:hypothetical protein